MKKESHQPAQQIKHLQILLQDISGKFLILPFKRTISQDFQCSLSEFLIETDNEWYEAGIDFLLHQILTALFEGREIDEDATDDPFDCRRILEEGIQYFDQISLLFALPNQLRDHCLLLRHVEQQQKGKLQLQSSPLLQFKAHSLHHRQVVRQEFGFSCEVDEGRQGNGGQFGCEDVLMQQGHERGGGEHAAGLGSGSVLQDGTHGSLLHFGIVVGQQLQQITHQLTCQHYLLLLGLHLLLLLLHQQLQHITHPQRIQITHPPSLYYPSTQGCYPCQQSVLFNCPHNFIMSSPSKLFSCVEADEICKSPLNRSPAKHQYSFSRSDRFKLAKPYCDNIYDLPSMRMTRRTSLGFGKKTDLDYGKHRHNVTPSPDNYKIDSFVDLNASHQRGMTTHVGRELTTPRSYIELDRIKFPGPGRYDQFRHNQTPKWTMRPVTNPELFDKTTQKIVPGPGAYEFNQDIHPTGKYYASKYRSSGSKAWNPPSSQRFYKSTTDAPGSGNYFPVNDMSDSGKYVLSTNKGQGRRRLDQEFRGSFVNVPAKITKTPGPGSYRLPSDFGQYDQLALNKSELA